MSQAMGLRARASWDGAVKFHYSLPQPGRALRSGEAWWGRGVSPVGNHRGASSARGGRRGRGSGAGSRRGAGHTSARGRLCVPAVTSVPPRPPPQRGVCADAAALLSDIARQRCSVTHSRGVAELLPAFGSVGKCSFFGCLPALRWESRAAPGCGDRGRDCRGANACRGPGAVQVG